MKRIVFFLIPILIIVLFSCMPSYESRMRSMGMVEFPSEDAQIERTGYKWKEKLGAFINTSFFIDSSWDTLSNEYYNKAIEQGTITPLMYEDIMRIRNNMKLTFQFTIKSKSIDEAQVKNWTYFLETSNGLFFSPIKGRIISTRPIVTSSVVTPDISWSGFLNQGPGFSGGGSVSFDITRLDLIENNIKWIKLYFDWSVLGQQRVSEMIDMYNKNKDMINNNNILDNFKTKSQFKFLEWRIDKMEIEKIPKMKSLY